MRIGAGAVGRVVAALGLALLATGAVSAQSGPAAAPAKASAPPRFEIGGGASWLGGYGLGSRQATLTGNTGTPGGQVVLFSVEAEVGAGPGLGVQVGYWVTRRVAVEAAFGYGRPELRTSISSDFEQAPPAVASDTLSQYIVEGAVRVHVLGVTGPPRAFSPFVSAGVGYLRQLTSDALTVETGTVFSAGGGAVWTLGTRARGFWRAWGARADARLSWRTGGVDIEDRTRMWPSAGGGVFARF
jgi:hypothetical protein